VFEMLRRQNRQVEFTGGLEARALEDYQVDLLVSLRPRPSMFFAYDPGDDFETLEHAARRLVAAGLATSHRMRVYVLIGYPKDTFALAEARLKQMVSIAFTPMAMLWRPETPSEEKYAPMVAGAPSSAGGLARPSSTPGRHRQRPQSASYGFARRSMPIGQNAGREDGPEMCTTATAMYTFFNARPVTPLPSRCAASNDTGRTFWTASWRARFQPTPE
jgi:hypothetical protein